MGTEVVLVCTKATPLAVHKKQWIFLSISIISLVSPYLATDRPPKTQMKWQLPCSGSSAKFIETHGQKTPVCALFLHVCECFLSKCTHLDHNMWHTTFANIALGGTLRESTGDVAVVTSPETKISNLSLLIV